MTHLSSMQCLTAGTPDTPHIVTWNVTLVTSYSGVREHGTLKGWHKIVGLEQGMKKCFSNEQHGPG